MTHQSHPQKPTMKNQILRILKDGRWHGCSDFLHLGLSYRNRICELREEGWEILSEKERGTVTYKYKLINIPMPASPPVQAQPPKVQYMGKQAQLF